MVYICEDLVYVRLYGNTKDYHPQGGQNALILFLAPKSGTRIKYSFALTRKMGKSMLIMCILLNSMALIRK